MLNQLVRRLDKERSTMFWKDRKSGEREKTQKEKVEALTLQNTLGKKLGYYL